MEKVIGKQFRGFQFNIFVHFAGVERRQVIIFALAPFDWRFEHHIDASSLFLFIIL